MKQKWYFRLESGLALSIASIFTFVSYQLWGFWCVIIPMLLSLFYFKVFILWLLSLLIVPLVLFFSGRWEAWSWLGLYIPVGIYFISWTLMEKELHKRAKEGITPEQLAKSHFKDEFRKATQSSSEYPSSGLSNQKEKEIRIFKRRIEEQENLLFGISLFYQGTIQMWAADEAIVKINRESYERTSKRMKEALMKARELLFEIQENPNKSNLLQQFEFPPTIDEVAKRSRILVEAYEELFAGRPREKPLNQEENIKLMEIASNRL